MKSEESLYYGHLAKFGILQNAQFLIVPITQYIGFD